MAGNQAWAGGARNRFSASRRAVPPKPLFKRVANGGPGGAPSSPAWLERLTAALGRFIRLNQLQLWVGSGSLSRALERPVSRVKLTFTLMGSLGREPSFMCQTVALNATR